MFVCIVMYICLVFYYIFSRLLGSGWFGCLFVLMYCKSVVCFKCFLVLLYIFSLPSLLGSGWLGCLPLSGSPGLYTPTVLCISCRLYAYTVYTSLCHYHTNDVLALSYWQPLVMMPLLCCICHYCDILS